MVFAKISTARKCVIVNLDIMAMDVNTRMLLPSPTKEHNISYNPLVPKVDVVDLDVHNSTSNGTEVKLTGCRAEQFSDAGERVESNVCSNHGVCRLSCRSNKSRPYVIFLRLRRGIRRAIMFSRKYVIIVVPQMVELAIMGQACAKAVC